MVTVKAKKKNINKKQGNTVLEKIIKNLLVDVAVSENRFKVIAQKQSCKVSWSS